MKDGGQLFSVVVRNANKSLDKTILEYLGIAEHTTNLSIRLLI